MSNDSSPFDLDAAFASAEARLGGASRGRSDRGRSRLGDDARALLSEALGGDERPRMAAVMERLREGCARPPSRATVYSYMARVRTPERKVSMLPPAVREALYNLGEDSLVPEAQVAFYCFNYGDLAAMSYAAALPWLAIYQAKRMRGWRQKSRGVIDAVALVRKI